MKKTIYKRFWFWLIIFTIIIIIIAASSNGGNANNILNDSTISDTAATQDSLNKDSSTVGERMALSSAKNYLRTMGFSKKGLIRQLEFEGYSTTEATYAVNNCGANWNEQAVRVAKNYLNTMGFSKQGLIDQLIFEGFTDDEATYGANNAYK